MMKAGFFSQGGITLVGSTTLFDLAGEFVLDISGVDFQAGDIGVVCWATDDYDASYTVTPTFSELYRSGSGDENPASYVGVRTMDGTETTISTDGYGSSNDTSIIFAAFRGAAEPSTIATAHGPSGSPNPPSVTVTSSDLVVAMGMLEDEEITFTAPTDYTLVATIAGGGGVTASSCGMAYRGNVSGTEDPGAFGGGADDAWDAHTLVLERA